MNIIPDNVYPSKYINDKKLVCSCCGRGYSQSYNIKYNSDDSDVVDEKKDLFIVCRKCMLSKNIDTKIKKRCSECLSFYKLKCSNCLMDSKYDNNILTKIKLLMKKVKNKNTIKIIIYEITKSYSDEKQNNE